MFPRTLPWVVPLLIAMRSGVRPAFAIASTRRTASDTDELPSFPPISPTSDSYISPAFTTCSQRSMLMTIFCSMGRKETSIENDPYPALIDSLMTSSALSNAARVGFCTVVWSRWHVKGVALSPVLPISSLISTTTRMNSKGSI